jgi:hypothetical protein
MNACPDMLAAQATQGLRALHYVQEEIRHLHAINRTREGDHVMLVFRLMLREVWGKEFRDGQFVFLEAQP